MSYYILHDCKGKKTYVWHSVTLCTEAGEHVSTVIILCEIKYSQLFTLNALKFKHEH